jgi:hypothetical protein
MLANKQMKQGRYEVWANCRKLYADIMATLNAGRRVQVTTYMKSWVYDSRHASMFTCGKTGVYVAQGKKRVCINEGSKFSGCGIRFIS